MASGGGDFGNEETPILEKTDDKDDDTAARNPFQPDASSSFSEGEQFAMKTQHQEKNPDHPGPPSFETSFSGKDVSDEELEKRFLALVDGRTGILDLEKASKQGILLTKEEKSYQLEKAYNYFESIKGPKGNPRNLILGFFNKEKPNEIMVKGPSANTKVFLNDGSGLTSKFMKLKFVQKILGKTDDELKKENLSLSSPLKMDSFQKNNEEWKKRKQELDAEKEKNDAIVNNKNSSPAEIESANQRNNEIRQEQNDIQNQRDAAMENLSTRDRLIVKVKDIFKKYGVTVSSVLLAAGVTIGVVVSTVTDALKATGKALGKGLKDIGSKLGSILPGLIGTVANFLFKTAGKAIGFLAEHSWLLILAVVGFLFEKTVKKRR